MSFSSGIGSGPSGMAPWTPWIDIKFLKILVFSRFFDIFFYFFGVFFYRSRGVRGPSGRAQNRFRSWKSMKKWDFQKLAQIHPNHTISWGSKVRYKTQKKLIFLIVFDGFQLWDRFWTLLDGPLAPLNRYNPPQKNSKFRFFIKFLIFDLWPAINDHLNL